MTVRSGAFLQSAAWEAFQKSLGREVRRFDGTLMIKQTIGLGMRYWYCPRAPLPKNFPTEAIFVRHDAPHEQSNYPITQLPNYRFAPHNVQPPTTIIIDLKKTEAELLQAMHPKTRYNIRVSERRGVTVQVGGAEMAETFWQMLQATSQRDQFRSHQKSYYQKMLTAKDSDTNFFFALAKVDNQCAAIALMVDYDGARTYLHGASDHSLRASMAPFALHWWLIKEAKNRGLMEYDFWGIASTDDPSEPLAGVTRFKKGWGGDIVSYPQTVDIVLCPMKYAFYRLVHRLITRT